MGSKIIKIMLMLIAITYVFGCVFMFVTKEEDANGVLVNFYATNKIAEMTKFESFFTIMYFNLTLLSSVGYGDYVPVNKIEMVYIVTKPIKSG